jgi:hypothetical protein
MDTNAKIQDNTSLVRDIADREYHAEADFVNLIIGGVLPRVLELFDGEDGETLAIENVAPQGFGTPNEKSCTGQTSLKRSPLSNESNSPPQSTKRARKNSPVQGPKASHPAPALPLEKPAPFSFDGWYIDSQESFDELVSKWIAAVQQCNYVDRKVLLVRFLALCGCHLPKAL